MRFITYYTENPFNYKAFPVLLLSSNKIHIFFIPTACPERCWHVPSRVIRRVPYS